MFWWARRHRQRPQRKSWRSTSPSMGWQRWGVRPPLPALAYRNVTILLPGNAEDHPDHCCCSPTRCPAAPVASVMFLPVWCPPPSCVCPDWGIAQGLVPMQVFNFLIRSGRTGSPFSRAQPFYSRQRTPTHESFLKKDLSREVVLVSARYGKVPGIRRRRDAWVQGKAESRSTNLGKPLCPPGSRSASKSGTRRKIS